MASINALTTLTTPATKKKERTIQAKEAPNALSVSVGDDRLLTSSKVFSSGSVGYYGNGKITVAGQQYQVGVTITLIGSKPL